MKLINPSVELITDIDGEAVLRHIEHATRVCYDSNDKVNEESHLKLLKTILDSHHYSVCEHFSVSIKIKCSRVNGIATSLARKNTLTVLNLLDLSHMISGLLNSSLNLISLWDRAKSLIWN
jgi:hypothetical protein